MPELKIKIGAEDKELKQKLAQNKNRIGKFAKDMKGALGSVFGAAGSIFTVAFITRAFGGLIDKMDQIGKASRALGVTSEGYQKIAYAARRANMPQDRLNMSFQRMANFMQASAQKGSKQEETLGRLKLTYGELIKMKPDEQFIAIGKAIDKVANATERLSIANKIYGRGARDVLNMVRGYEGMAQELQSRGGIISQEDIAAAEEYNDEIETLKTVIASLVTKGGQVQFGIDTVKGINDRMLRRREYQKEGKGVFAQFAEEAGMNEISTNKKDTGRWWKSVKAFLFASSGGLYGGKHGGLIGGSFADKTGERINKLYGAATSPEQRAEWRRRREEELLGPQASLGTMLGGRLGKPSADAMHQIGGYLTPGMFNASNTAEGHLASIDEKMTVAVERILTRRREWTPEMEQNFIGNSINGAGATQQ